MKARPAVALAGAALALAGCSLRPKPRPPVAVYDLGPSAPVAPAARLTSSVAVHEPAAPSHLQRPLLHFRMEKDDPLRLRAYGLSRWAEAPHRLLGRLLLARLAEASARGAVPAEAGTDTDLDLWLDLEEMGPEVDEAGGGRAVLRLRATLTARPGGGLLAQRAFAAEEPLARADAASAVAGLRTAAERLAADLVRWVAEAGQPRPSTRRGPVSSADRPEDADLAEFVASGTVAPLAGPPCLPPKRCGSRSRRRWRERSDERSTTAAPTTNRPRRRRPKGRLSSAGRVARSQGPADRISSVDTGASHGGARPSAVPPLPAAGRPLRTRLPELRDQPQGRCPPAAASR